MKNAQKIEKLPKINQKVARYEKNGITASQKDQNHHNTQVSKEAA